MEEGGGRREAGERKLQRVYTPPHASHLTPPAFLLIKYAGHMYLRAMSYKKLSMEELGRKSVAEFRTAEKSPVVVVLDNVRSMHNVGSVFRSADAFLVRGIYLCGYTPRPPHRDIHKTALGATETVHWEYEPEIIGLINRLKQEGFTICAVEQAEGSIPLQELEWKADQKIALVFGNEVDGVQDEVMALCDICIEIPQSGMKHSLNISVAAGIVLWEITRKTAQF
jgi:23S rRNA (guanosine2251-2'-O)-methyltransferase